MRRNRINYLIIVVITIVVGLLSRKLSAYLPHFVNIFLGDSLWAIMIFVGVGFLFNRLSTLKTGLLALLFCYFIEISQLYHAEWIDNIRHTTLGGLVLGFGFLWSDIAAYTLGVGVAVVAEMIFNANVAKRSFQA
jgi:hypothetical protein